MSTANWCHKEKKRKPPTFAPRQTVLYENINDNEKQRIKNSVHFFCQLNISLSSDPHHLPLVPTDLRDVICMTH
jgi:hypothetical protein